MSAAPILEETQDRVLTIRLNRPEKKNAITLAMYQGMADALKRAEADAGIRAVMFAGAPDCFTSGNDITDFLKQPPTDPDSPVLHFMSGMINASKPVLAAVNGVAIGIGVTLLLHCDLVFAGQNAKLQMPFVNIGICPEFGSSYLLPQIMGRQRAAELVLLGETFDVKVAREYGIVNYICPDAETEARARATAVKLAQQPPNALRTTKRLLRRDAAAVNEAVYAELEKFAPMLKGAEAMEAMTAFVQKRKPDFTKFS